MFTRLKYPAFAALVMALVLTPVWAFASGGMRVGIAGFGGYQTYSMSDVNDGIGQLNADAAAAGVTGTMDDISHGIGFGGGLHAWSKDNMFSLEYNRLVASSSGDFTDPSSGATATAEFKVPANGVTLGATHFFHSSHKTRLGLGLGVGYYSADGTEKVEDPSSGTTTSVDVTGHALGFHGMGMVDSPLSPMLHLEIGAGYRYAKSTNAKAGGVEVLNADGSKAKIDWSGLMTRAGLTFYFGQSSQQ
ncbi:MAG: hypothetical protein E6K74_02520 [Candidatus Eisenbacteria bacterium]|uniref:Porin family protein n=1 Tax=Eiseniibacteriota bacterium TaxID=2212470 RepID=A0A538SWA6_UNCEI|nr:MAG: hypothetical protein E6K74_02520 [Candidatus Eisenbacteria bacterium]